MAELTGPEFRELMHEAHQTEFDDMEPERADMARQLGLLFAANQEFAHWAYLISHITFTPADTPGTPPQATVTFVHGERVIQYKTDDQGELVLT